MATNQTLHGSCACGRNRYIVEVPVNNAQQAELRYDTTSASRSHAASPLTLWLRVPLSWYTSATFAQLPDETRSSIKRTFTSPSPFASNTRRQFCGYCGTQLTSWHERTHDDAEHILLTVGSLLDEDQALLAQLGYLPSGDSSDDETYAYAYSLASPSRQLPATRPTSTSIRSEPRSRGAPWFEELVADTQLGRFKQQRGGHSSADGHVRVEWEVVEWTEGDDADDESTGSTGKRKIGDVIGGDEDATMRND